MTRDEDLVAVLLKNADLLLAYNSQTGVLPNSKLEETLATARAEPKLDYHSDACIALRKEVFRIVNAMKPATLSELHDFPPYTALDDQNAEVEKTRRRHDVFRYALAALTLLLFVICAKYTIWSKQASILMADIEAAQGELASDRFNAVLNRWETLMVYELTNGSTTYVPPQVNAGEDFRLYRDYVETFGAIEARRASLMASLNPITTRLANWRTNRLTATQPETDIADSDLQVLDGGGYSTFAAQAPDPDNWIDHCLDEFKTRLETIFNEARGHPTIKPDGSIDTGQTTPPVLEVSHVKAWVSVEMRRAHRAAFVCFFGLPPERVASVETTRTTYLTTLRSLRDALDVLNSWVLPGVYGALGAMLLTLRVYVNPVQPNPRRFRTVMRIALGGFVGIVVGWFWSPQSNQLFEFANISVGLFTMAFLFGYGIDVFMNLLDRLVGGFSSAIENAGKQS